MDDVKGLIEWLEHRAHMDNNNLHREAATALTLAQARIRELETALEPFATRVLVATNLGDDLHPAWAPAFTVGEFRRAFRARSTKEAPDV